MRSPWTCVPALALLVGCAAPATAPETPPPTPAEPQPPAEPEAPVAAAQDCPAATAPPAEPAYSGSGTVVIGETVGKRTEPPRIKPNNPSASQASHGPLISTVIHRRARPAILSCYRSALEQCPGLSGRLTVAFSIDESGAATGVAVKGEGLWPPLDACVVEQVAGLAFPPDELMHLQVTWPFYFIAVKDLSQE